MRWKPTRAGIFNVWEYDDQTFEFGDGRLALRGRNGSGKSNALVLLFPFVLDGVMSAARMDPMGGGRSMRSLLLGRDDDDRRRPVPARLRHRLRVDGVRRRRTPRHGRDRCRSHAAPRCRAMVLHHVPTRWPRPRARRERHTARPAPHRGSPHRWPRVHQGRRLPHRGRPPAPRPRRATVPTLVDLLLTLRRPHLAGKLDTEHLSATLSAGLGELDPALVADVAHSFDDLDAMQHELEGLAARSQPSSASCRRTAITSSAQPASAPRASSTVSAPSAHWTASSTPHAGSRRGDESQGRSLHQRCRRTRRWPGSPMRSRTSGTRPPTRTPPHSMRCASPPTTRSGRPNRRRRRQAVDDRGVRSGAARQHR